MESEARAGRRGADVARWAVEEIAWLLVASLPWILLAAAGWFRTGLFGLHASVLAYGGFRERARLRRWLLPRTRDVLFGLGGGVAILLLGGAYGLALQAMGVELPDVAADLRALVPSASILLAWGACLVPLAEEVLFRGRWLDALDRLAGPAWATGGSSAVFMLVHGIPSRSA
jgi:membrane protease YdiL (CAAX protease family)